MMNDFVYVCLIRVSMNRRVLAEAPTSAHVRAGNVAAFTEDGKHEQLGLVECSDFLATDDDALAIFRALHPNMAQVTRTWSETWKKKEEQTDEGN